ncbi:MAG: hypothetical protein AABX66_03340 [Nanoarchaeota archaeon]
MANKKRNSTSNSARTIGDIFEKSLPQLLKGASTTNLFKGVIRKMQVADLKEVYSREYLLAYGLCTREEYDSIPASNSREEAYRNDCIIARLMSQVIGAESF